MEIDVEKKICLYKSSPYIYRENMQLVEYNEKSNVSTSEITKFLAKKLIGPLDMAILDALYVYKILNRHILELYLSYTVPKYKDKDLKNTLKKLVGLGMLIRYAYEYDEEGEAKKTPYFYALSLGSFKYVQRFTKHESCDEYMVMDTDTAYKFLAVNQFHVFFLKDYKDKVIKDIFHKNIAVGKENITLDASFRLKTKKLENKYVDIVVIPVRQNEEWKNELVSKILLLEEYTEKQYSYSPIFIFLAESDKHIKDIDLVIKENKIDSRGKIRLYTTDLQVAREPICNYLYECLPEKEGNSTGNVILAVRKLLL